MSKKYYDLPKSKFKRLGEIYTGGGKESVL